MLPAELIFTLPAKAQLSFGIKGSYTNSWHSNDSELKLGGMGASVTFYKRFGKILEIGIEPGVVQRGSNQLYVEPFNYLNFMCCFGDCFTPALTPGNKSQNIRMTYLQAPVYLRANIPMANGKLAIIPKIGGGASWLASGYYDTNVMDEETFQIAPETKPLDFSSDGSLKRLDYGIQGGVGIGYNMGFGQLIFESELYRGFKKLNDYEGPKNRSLSYSLSYMLNL